MADLTEPKTTDDAEASCCSTEAQATCCEPTDKAECCGESASGGSCGCSAGGSTTAGTDGDDLPDTATMVSLGCGNPTAVAALVKSGGRFAVSDVVADEDMDAATKADMQQITGCIRARKPQGPGPDEARSWCRRRSRLGAGRCQSCWSAPSVRCRSSAKPPMSWALLQRGAASGFGA
jgi:hypothetical protein